MCFFLFVFLCGRVNSGWAQQALTIVIGYLGNGVSFVFTVFKSVCFPSQSRGHSSVREAEH